MTRGSRWGLRLVAFAVAAAVWFFVNVEHRGQRIAEKQIDANVTYNTPRGVILLEPVEKVSVRVSGRTQRIRNLNPLAVDVLVDLSDAAAGTRDVRLEPQNVFTPEGLEVLSISPNVLHLTLDRQISRVVPVQARLVGEAAAGAVVEQVATTPDRVLASGPESRLARIGFLPTNPVVLDGHALAFEETAAVLSPDPLVQVVQPSVVTVRVQLRLPTDDAAVPARPETPAERIRRRAADEAQRAGSPP